MASQFRRAALMAAATVVLVVVGSGAARAEFFGCNDRPGQVLYDSRWHHANRYSRYARDHSARVRRAGHARVTYARAPRYDGIRSR
jgi:hypothetical protein